MKRSLAGLAAIWLGVSVECGCLGPATEPSEALPAPPEVAALEPAVDVAPDAPVVVRFSAPVQLASRVWPVRVETADRVAVDFGVTMEDEGRTLRVLPRPSWPEGASLVVVIEPGFVDGAGQPLLLGGLLSFSTRAAPDPEPELTVRSPLPASSAPLNLALVTVALEPPPKVAPERVLLVSGGARVEATVERLAPEGLVVARLPPYRGACAPLCGRAIYRVGLDGPGRAAAGARGQVVTATVADVVPPTVTATTVVLRGDRVVVRVKTSEPVLLSGFVAGAGADPIALETPLVPSAETFVEATAPLPPDVDVSFVLSGEDVAGNALAPVTIAVHTPPRLAVTISELVAAPTHDWGDSEAEGAPFDGRPGRGSVTAADAWVELVNLSNDAIDLRHAGLYLRAIDGTPTETALSSPPGAYFGDGGSLAAWLPGEALVVRPRGTLSRRRLTLEVVSGETVLDRVEVGEVQGAIATSAAPPDLVHESLARGVDGRFRWCEPTPGDPLPNTACLAGRPQPR